MLADRCFYERAEQAATVGGGVGWGDGGVGRWGARQGDPRPREEPLITGCQLHTQGRLSRPGALGVGDTEPSPRPTPQGAGDRHAEAEKTHPTATARNTPTPRTRQVPQGTVRRQK